MIWNSKTIVKLVGLALLTAGSAVAPLKAIASQDQKAPGQHKDAAKEKKLMDRAGGPFGSAFIQNKGQWDSRALFFSSGQNVDTWITKSSVIYDFHGFQPAENGFYNRYGHVVEMQFQGASNSAVATGDKDAKRVVHFVGVNSSVTPKSYLSATVHNLYDGVDLQLSRENGSPRFDILVGPGKDASKVKLTYKGANGIAQNPDGTLRLGTSIGDQTIANLHAFQNGDGKEVPVKCNFVLNGDGTVGFKVGPHNPKKGVTIDPVVYSTLLGDNGNGGTQAFGEWVGTDAEPVITGYTQAPNFPITIGAYNGLIEGNAEAYNANPAALTGSASVFVTKFTNDASDVIYSTVINSVGVGTGIDVVVDPSGKIFLSGIAQNGYSVFEDSYQNQVLFGATYAQFLTILNPDASQLLVSTFFGGGFNLPGGDHLGDVKFRGGDDPRFYDNYLGLFIDGEQNIYLTGKGTVAATPNAYQTQNQGDGTYIACFTDSGVFSWASYFTAPGTTTSGTYIANDGSFYLCGETNGGLAATQGAFSTQARGEDAYVARLNAVKTPKTPLTESYVTYIGGSGQDAAQLITADSIGEAYVYGSTNSVNFPYSPNAFSRGNGAGGSFMAKLPVDGSRLIYSTLDGDYGTVTTSIAVDTLGELYAVGSINPKVPFTGISVTAPPPAPPYTDYILFNQFNFTEGAATPPFNYYSPGDVYITVMNQSGTGLVYSGYFGGTYDEQAEKVVLDAGNNVYMVGWTDSYVDSDPSSTEYPVTGGVFDDFYERVPEVPPLMAPAYVPPMAFLTKMRAIPIPFLDDLEIPTVIAGGLTATGTVSLSFKTPSIISVGLVSSDPSIANVPSSLTIVPSSAANPGNGAGATFIITTPDLTVIHDVTITASMDDIFISRTATVVPYLQSFSCAVPKIVGGNATTARAIISIATPLPTVPPDQSVNIPVPYLPLTVWSSDTSKAAPVGGAPGAGGIGEVYFINTSYIDPITGLYTPSVQINVPIQTYGVDNDSTVTLFCQLNGYKRIVTSTLEILPASVEAVQFTPDVLTGGNISNGTIQMNGNVGPTPITVNLAQTAGLAQIALSAKTFTLAPQSNSEPFTATTVKVTSNQFATVTASEPLNASSAQGTLYMTPVTLSDITAGSTIITGGSTTPGYVTLATAAPLNGINVNLSTTNPSLLDVSTHTVTVPAGSTLSNTFTIKSVVTKIEQVVTITATDGAYTATLNMTVMPEALTIATTPASVQGGLQNITGSVKLSRTEDQPLTVKLTSSNASALVLSTPTLTFAPGVTSMPFSAYTNVVPSTVSVTISASVQALQGPIVATSVVTVVPLPLVIDVVPSTLIGGVQNGVGDVVVSQKVAVPTAVTLTSSNPAVVGVPATVTIPAGTNIANFTVTTAAVLQNTNVIITGRDSAGSNTFAVTVTPAVINLVSLAISPSSVYGGYGATGTLTTSGAVPKAGVNIALTSSSPASAAVPSTVLLKQGATTATFPITTTQYTADVTVTIDASYNGKGVHGTLIVLAGRVGTLTIAPSEVVGGTNTTLTVSINAPAPAGGLVVTLSDSPYLAGITVNGKAIPNGGSITVTIPAGLKSAAFPVTTPAVSRQLGTTFTAIFGTNGNQSSATLLMDPAS